VGTWVVGIQKDACEVSAVQMSRIRGHIAGFVAFIFLMMLSALPCMAQGAIFHDSEGKLVSNNEFVDIRMANYLSKDATVVKTRPDGVVEFFLKAIPQEGKSAPAFDAKTLTGERVNPQILAGKVVVLNFWFIGCASCRAHQPKLNELKGRFADQKDVVFVAATTDPEAEVRSYLGKERFDYLQIAGAQAMLKLFDINEYPKNIVIGRDGRIVYWRSGITAWNKFESVIRTELAK